MVKRLRLLRRRCRKVISRWRLSLKKRIWRLKLKKPNLNQLNSQPQKNKNPSS